MKENIKPATGRLGVLVVGVGGAVAVSYTHLPQYRATSGMRPGGGNGAYGCFSF